MLGAARIVANHPSNRQIVFAVVTTIYRPDEQAEVVELADSAFRKLRPNNLTIHREVDGELGRSTVVFEVHITRWPNSGAPKQADRAL